jgi:cyclopropane fatty-acyl-phospholipid synthase-like methyltransferase
MMKEFAPACDRNSQVILDVLKPILARAHSVLEIGSGTGQHAVCFAEGLPHLQWQPSNKESLGSIKAWSVESQLKNISPAISLNLLALDEQQLSRLPEVDAIVCINTIHIMAWQGTEGLFELANEILPVGGVVYVYGPYRYSDQPLEASNENFDLWLKGRDALSGIRDFDQIDNLAKKAGFKLQADIAMPANNRSIWWKKM